MIRAKLLAMCVCPAIAAPPTVMAVSPLARRAVAHMLHQGARRLDHPAPLAETLPQVAASITPIPCAPTIALSAAATPQLSPNLPNNLGRLGQTQAFTDLSQNRFVDRAPTWTVRAASIGAPSESQTTTVRIAAVDVSSARATATNPRSL